MHGPLAQVRRAPVSGPPLNFNAGQSKPFSGIPAALSALSLTPGFPSGIYFRGARCETRCFAVPGLRRDPNRIQKGLTDRNRSPK